MPKKTRQEKMLAQLKRLQQQQHNPVVNSSSDDEQVSTAPSVSINLKSLQTSQNTPDLSQKPATYEYAYVYKDLRKTLIFAALAVFFEFALSRLV